MPPDFQDVGNGYINASKWSRQEISAKTQTNVVLDRLVANTNPNLFELKDNKIYCKFDGIVMIDTLIQWGYVSGLAYTYIKKNDEMIGSFYNDLDITKQTTIINVKVGDYISLDCYNNVNSAITNYNNWDYLIVAKI